ncbi:MAG: hypothetical protein HOP17_07485 [Acidobacteria bacterium]|nr:hypothetical protein [Acidobacteriota bacterium]
MLDTSVFATYKDRIDSNFDSFYFSIIVFYELIASTIDESALQKYERWQTALNKAGKLIVPTKTDWINTAKAVRRLRHQRLINKNLPATKLQNDALIARAAVFHGCFVVTENIRDFALLQKVMPKLDVIPAVEYFR